MPSGPFIILLSVANFVAARHPPKFPGKKYLSQTITITTGESWGRWAWLRIRRGNSKLDFDLEVGGLRLDLTCKSLT